MEISYKSAFDAIADTPEEALNLKIRANLMREIEIMIKANRWTQKEAAQKLGVTQPRISDLLRGSISKFSIDMLVNMLATMGGRVELKVVA
ncbi:MAG: XRE family transcriptional regulator [Cycloclasticus sp.]|nr:XRE family transcriptional regulator [Cycloclasticus sp.]